MQQQRSLKIAAGISLAVLGILLAGSIVFYKERMLFSDAVWIAFHTVNTGSIQIQVERYGSFITQMFPVIASKMGLSLKTILVLYSLSFNLFYFVAGWILFCMRRYALVILLTLFHTIFVSEAYFWTNNEVYQGVTWMFIMFGTTAFLYEKLTERMVLFYLVSIPVFTVLAFFSIYTHPLVMLPTAFLWVFLCVSGKEKFFRSLHSLLFAILLIAIAAFKVASSKNNYYDGNILQKVFKSTLGELIGTFTSGMADIFWKNLLSNHWLIAFIFVAGIIYLLKQKKYLLSICTIGAALCYFMLMCLTFSDGSKPYIESEWMCLAIIGAAPFVYYLLPVISTRNALIIVSFILVVRLAYIAAAVPRYASRIKMITTITDIMKQRGITKAVIKKTDERLENKSIIGWGLPIETLFTSIMEHDTVQRTAICLSEDEINRSNPQALTKDIILPFWTTPISQLNKRYFRPDTTQAYQVSTYEEFFGDKIGVLATD